MDTIALSSGVPAAPASAALVTEAPDASAPSMGSSISAPKKPFRGKWPCRIFIPGALIDLIEIRRREVREGTLSKYFTELAAYDLRERRAHSLTGRIARFPAEVQQAIDLAIRGHYRKGQKSNKEQIARLVARGFADALLHVQVEPLMKKIRLEIYLRRMHSGIIGERMKQLGFAHLSEYLTSLARFDLLVSGPHKHYGGKITLPKAEALDEMTLYTYETKPPKKCMIDYVVEEIAGRELAPEEREAVLEKVAVQLADEAAAAQKRARKAG